MSQARSPHFSVDPAHSRSATASPPRLVLDTNVVLDWLFFEDPGCFGLSRAITSSRFRWVATAPMQLELEHVLERGMRSGRGRAAGAVLAAWTRWVSLVPAGDPPPLQTLICTDRDDQKFIDLALQTNASALLSRDRAVLKLARRASARGLQIATVGDWGRRDSDSRRDGEPIPSAIRPAP